MASSFFRRPSLLRLKAGFTPTSLTNHEPAARNSITFNISGTLPRHYAVQVPPSPGLKEPVTSPRDTDKYWQKVKIWENVTKEDFLSYRWQGANTIERQDKLLHFLEKVLPEVLPQPANGDLVSPQTMKRDDFLADVLDGMRLAPMSIRLTPHMLSVVDWTNPIVDPIRRQFIPLKSTLVRDLPRLALDSLYETHDSPVPGLVHRYPEKVLFLATSVCPVYCRFCTRSYAVGGPTESVNKTPTRPGRKRWEAMFEYIEKTPVVQDIVVSGGDSYMLHADHLRLIGERLLAMPNVKRFRFATKGLAVCPMRILDHSDGWTEAFVELSNKGRSMGKQVAMHTHFNHPKEITWVTELAARRLFEHGVTVRNQTVLLRGVNDDLETMSTLIRRLADLNIQPYYVYQADMVRGVEDMRSPLWKILELEKHIRGTIAGFMTPSFIVDLPGGGGKRLANSFETYDRASGISTWKAPGVTGDEVFEYHDPVI
ncbi:hypothetical protein LTR36_004668 [Oleoguttula mirabilis]|uniref:L-lysine 2,3-aminomutase n=1 Tax=Oleoguttula mirabilis TaxID=1507867 RepID=A0AAV9JEZ8_9PEZI|nr:hypothetical protein LTR36_004668 [Oleoguttula mirabilis]